MIPDHLRRELRYIEISTQRALRTARLGAYTSRLRGAGFDFDQHVPYRPGDDVRLIDWNVTARLNVPFRRETHAERELDIVLALDVSASMALDGGARPKKEVLMLISAAVVFSAARDQITTGFLTFADRVRSWSPPRRVGAAAWQTLDAIWTAQTAGRGERDTSSTATTLVPAARHLVNTLRTTSLVVVISDFWLAADAFRSPEMRMLAARHDTILVVIDHPADRALPAGRGFVRTRDVETGQQATIPLTEYTRRAYAAAVGKNRQAIVDGCYRHGMDYVFIRADQAVVEPVMELFARRKSA